MNTTGRINPNWVSSIHWPEVVRFDQEFFPRPWSLKDWEGLNQDNHELFSLTEASGLTGFALFSYLKGDETAHLLKICLQPGLRGSELAQNFWDELVTLLKQQEIKNVYLEVEETNFRARGFYKKVGFQELRIVKGYYSDGTSGVMMNLTL